MEHGGSIEGVGVAKGQRKEIDLYNLNNVLGKTTCRYVRFLRLASLDRRAQILWLERLKG